MRTPTTIIAVVLVWLVALVCFANELQAQTYCASASTSNFDSDITRVRLETIDNFTGTNVCANYTYFNNLSTNLAMGGNYQIIVDLGVHTGAACGSDVYTKSAVVFIDYNGNSTFDNNERVGATSYSAGSFSSNINFTVPCSAVSGTTRMRIVCQENTAAAIAACGTYAYGETEDYNINILPQSNPSANFSIPDTIYTGANATFFNANQLGYTHQWYNSNVDPTLNTVSSNAVNYTTSFNNPGNYQIRLASTNCQGTALVTKNITVVNPTSLPVAEFVSSANVVFYNGIDPVTIQLFDLSLFGANAWTWTVSPDQLNGGQWVWLSGNEFSQNPTILFYDYGIYEVCLQVENALGQSSPLCKTAYIQITQPTGANFINVMGTDVVSTLDSGFIYDSGGSSGDYGSNEFNSFTIEPCGATEVTLSFIDFNTEMNVDRLSVYDGPNSSSPLLGAYSGNNLPASITAKSGVMHLEFASNASNVATGFAAVWSSLIPNNGAPKADFTIPDTVYACTGGSDVIFRNASSGIIPGQATYDWIAEYDPFITYPLGYCEVCDDEKFEWTYSTNQTYNVRMVLKSCEGNDTIAKSFVLAGTTNNPIVDFTTSSRKLMSGESAVLKDNSVAGCSYEWIIFPTTYTILNGGSLNDPEVEVQFTSPGSYNVTLKVTNDNGTSTRTRNNYIDVIQYCIPTVNISNIADVGISKVTIDNIEMESGTGIAPGYTDYTEDAMFTFFSGQSYNVTVSRLNPAVNNLNRKIWIDWNRDGDFDDANELVASESSSTNINFSASITVPNVNQLDLGLSRMRVGVSISNTANNPCGPNNVGEFEDYGILLEKDNYRPIITLLGSDTVLIEKNTLYTDAGATAFDNIEGNISQRIMVTNLLDTTQSGVYYIIYNVSDGSGNDASPVTRVIIVADDITNPIITVLGDNPYLQSVHVPFVDPFVSVIDNPGNQVITSNTQTIGMVDVTVIGDYVLEYEVSDNFGNMAKASRLVMVRDTTPPTFNTPSVVKWQVNVPFNNQIAVSDNYYSMVDVNRISGNVNPFVIGTYNVTFEAIDGSNNKSVATIQFVVDDTIAPVIATIPGSDLFLVDVYDVNYKEPVVFATDNYYLAVRLKRDASALDVTKLGNYPVVYTATDGSGNIATYTRTIRVLDRTCPTFYAPPANVWRWTSFDPLDGVSASDNYNTPQWFVDNNAIQVIFNNVDINYPGFYLVSYRLKDEAGNDCEEFDRIVNVMDPDPNSVEAFNQGKLKIYPNPTNGRVQIETNAGLSPDAKIICMNALGQIVSTFTKTDFNNGVLQINLNDQSNGVYVIKLIDGGNTYTEIIILSK